MAASIKDIKEVQIPQEYELIKAEFVEEADSFVLTLRHRKSQARVVVFSNEDENKVFNGFIYNLQCTICLCCGASGKLYRLLYLMIYSLFYSLLSSTIYSLFARPHCIANCTVHCTLKILFKISCYLLVQMHTVASQDVVLVRGIDKQIGIGTGIHARLHE